MFGIFYNLFFDKFRLYKLGSGLIFSSSMLFELRLRFYKATSGCKNEVFSILLCDKSRKLKVFEEPKKVADMSFILLWAKLSVMS